MTWINVGIIPNHLRKTSNLISEEKAHEMFLNISKESGKMYGYPDCCIKEFVNQKFGQEPTPFDKIRWQASHMNGEYTGFIPCIKHALLIVGGNLELKNLIANRNANLKMFPDDWTQQ